MRATVYHGPGDMRVENVPDPQIQQSTDAIVRITHACICGSDLWFYRGLDNWQPGWRAGHEWMRIVEEVGFDSSPVLDLSVDLDGVPSGYAAMDSRETIKVMVRP
ncbi:alcohol dehydrogenase [Fischerella sp. NIES-4106]|nr:alcohol dehydrogenase [Fischerella sp. NIES-4106]